MIKTLTDLKAREGKTIFLEMAPLGWLEYTVTRKANEPVSIDNELSFKCEAATTNAYDLTFYGNIADDEFEEYVKDHPMFDTLEDVHQHIRECTPA